MAAFLLGALSIVGLPPMGGTWSKLLLVQATLDSEVWVLTMVLLLSSLLNLAYLLAIPIRAFFAKPSPPAPDWQAASAVGWEAPPACLLAIAVTAFGCLLLFLMPDPLYQLAAGVLK